MKVSDYIIETLRSHGVTHIFGFAGGAITHLLDSICRTPGIEFISTHHEQAAAFAAEGYARVSGKIGVAMATSGPGAINLATGVGSSYFDSVPCLYLTGQVNTYEYKFERPLRQLGFQETDVVSIARPITKDAVLLTDPNQTAYVLSRLLHLAQDGRPGPVLLDVPMDIQRAEIDLGTAPGFERQESSPNGDCGNLVKLGEVKGAMGLISESQRPIIIVGGGIRLAAAESALRKFVDKAGIPFVCTLMGLDALPHDHHQAFGFIGAYGNRYGNYALANSDLIIVLGSRLTARQTGTSVNNFARGAKIVHIDIDPNELGSRLKETLSVCMDVREFLEKAYQYIRWQGNAFAPWLQWLQSVKSRYLRRGGRTPNGLDPYSVLAKICDMSSEDEVFVADVGQNQMWTAQGISVSANQRVLFSGGMGSMGFAVPAAIGAFFADHSRSVTAIVGDGGLQMNIQELHTAIRNCIPLKVVLLNNNSLGMIRQFQQLYFEGRCYGSIEGYDSPNFQKLAEAYGWRYVHVGDLEDLNAVSQCDSAVLFEVPVSMDCDVVPKLEVNRPIEDQNPLLDRDEFRSNMLIEPDISSLKQ
ncbi:MAG TPA: thiamine pyrophosphate-binding protein [Spirochaetia bacterium]|nr:thiamine pyrophosphate-binding protein [Spirochaetia bacterium]